MESRSAAQWLDKLATDAAKFQERSVGPSGFIVQPAGSFEDLCCAFRLVHDQYCANGLMQPAAGRLRFFLRDLLSSTTVFVAKQGRRVIGTATALQLGFMDLPCSELFEHELNQLIGLQRRPIETSKFACATFTGQLPRGPGQMSVVGGELLRWLYGWCCAHDVSDWLVVVHPRVRAFYVEELGFDALSHERECSHVAGKPGVLLRFDVAGLRCGIKCATATARELFLEPLIQAQRCYSSYQLAADQVALLLSSQPQVLADANDTQRQLLDKVFPGACAVARQEQSRHAQLAETPCLLESFVTCRVDRLGVRSVEPRNLRPRPFALRAHLAGLEKILQIKIASRSLGLVVQVSDDIPDALVTDPDVLGRALVKAVDAALCNTSIELLRFRIELFSQRSENLQLRLVIQGLPSAGLGHIDTLMRRLGGHTHSFMPQLAAVSWLFPAIHIPNALHLRAVCEMGLQDPVDRVEPSLKILVVDDNLVAQVLLKRLLSRWGHRVTVCPDGMTALRSLTHRNYDLVLMDVQLPALDGFEVTKRLRQFELINSYWPTLVYALTSFVMEGDRQRCLAAGMDGYLAKPALPLELSTVLRQAARWARQRELAALITKLG